MTERERLPDRRLQVVETVAFEGRTYLLGIGFHPDGRAGEIFLKGTRIGSEAERLFDDACVLASLLLQCAWTANQLATRLGREGTGPGAGVASALGAALKAAADLEAEAAQGIREAYAAEGELRNLKSAPKQPWSQKDGPD